MPADTPADAERLAKIRALYASSRVQISFDVPFLLRLLDEREAEIARLQGAQVPSGSAMEQARKLLDRMGVAWNEQDNDCEIVATALTAAAQSARDQALEEAAAIADGGARLAETGPELRFVTARKFATDLAKDIADGIRSFITAKGEGT